MSHTAHFSPELGETFGFPPFFSGLQGDLPPGQPGVKAPTLTKVIFNAPGPCYPGIMTEPPGAAPASARGALPALAHLLPLLLM